MKPILQKAEEYLGSELFKLYQERHPEVSPDTYVVLILRDYAWQGFQIAIPQEVSVFDLSPIVKINLITIKPEDFETWAMSKDSQFFRLAFVQELNSLYVATLAD